MGERRGGRCGTEACAGRRQPALEAARPPARERPPGVGAHGRRRRRPGAGPRAACPSLGREPGERLQRLGDAGRPRAASRQIASASASGGARARRARRRRRGPARARFRSTSASPWRLLDGAEPLDGSRRTGRPARGRVAGGQGDLAQAVERPGDAVLVAQLAPDGQRLLVEGARPGRVAGGAQRRPEAVQDGGDAVAVAEAPVDGEALLVGAPRRVVVALLARQPAERTEREGEARLVVRLPEERQALRQPGRRLSGRAVAQHQRQVPEQPERRREHAAGLAERPGQGGALLPPRPPGGGVAQESPPPAPAQREGLRSRPRRRAGAAAAASSASSHARASRQVAAREPEPGQGAGEAQALLDRLRLRAVQHPAQGGAAVVVLPLQAVEPPALGRALQLRLRRLGQRREAGQVAAVDGVRLPARREPLPGVLPQRLQQAEPGVALAVLLGDHQRAVDQPGQQVQDLAGRRERGARPPRPPGRPRPARPRSATTRRRRRRGGGRRSAPPPSGGRSSSRRSRPASAGGAAPSGSRR